METYGTEQRRTGTAGKMAVRRGKVRGETTYTYRWDANLKTSLSRTASETLLMLG